MGTLIESWKPLVALLAILVGLLELGRFFGRRKLRADPAWDGRGVNAMESTVLALLGLLLAFTFSGAWTRFDARRDLILRESNAIGTAWLRLDLVAAPARARLQEAFRRYVDLRIAATRHSETKPSAEIAAAQRVMWDEAVAAAQTAPDARVAQLLLPAVNDVFDLASARYVAVENHPPALIYVTLFAILLLAVLLAGFGMATGKSRHWLHIACFLVSLTFAIYVTIDLEYPRHGWVRVDNLDQLLVDLRATMK